MIYFTSDHHFGHENIIKYCHRPFESVKEMNQEMIWQWNNVVASDDIVYHLGDFTLLDEEIAQWYFSRLSGQIRILSNPWHHDKRWLRWAMSSKHHQFISGDGAKVQLLPPMVVLELDKGKKWPLVIVLCHYPLSEWDRKHYGAWHLHGHSHGNLRPIGLMLDVGVDQHNFVPVSLDQVTELMGAKA